MEQETIIEKASQTQIQELEKCIVAGDLSGMAGLVALLHEQWGSLSENEQQDVLKLEAIFLSMAQLRTGAG